MSKQSKDLVEKTDGMRSLPSVTTGCVSTKFHPFNLGQDSVQWPSRGVRQTREVAVFQIQEVVSEIGKTRNIYEKSADGEDRLVIWLRWIA